MLARHHAAWFEHPLLQTLDGMPGLDDPSVLTLADTFAMGWPMFLERFGDDVPDRCLRWCEHFVEGFPAWIAGHRADRLALMHGDFRPDNLFVSDEGSVAVIDWQTSMRAPAKPTSCTSARTSHYEMQRRPARVRWQLDA